MEGANLPVLSTCTKNFGQDFSGQHSEEIVTLFVVPKGLPEKIAKKFHMDGRMALGSSNRHFIRQKLASGNFHSFKKTGTLHFCGVASVAMYLLLNHT